MGGGWRGSQPEAWLGGGPGPLLALPPDTPHSAPQPTPRRGGALGPRGVGGLPRRPSLPGEAAGWALGPCSSASGCSAGRVYIQKEGDQK